MRDDEVGLEAFDVPVGEEFFAAVGGLGLRGDDLDHRARFMLDERVVVGFAGDHWLEHKQAGNPVASWEGDSVVLIEANKIPVDDPLRQARGRAESA